jgi:microcystin-dependent protein
MSDQYLGEIRAFGFNFAPYGWFLCNGQTLSIQAYTALFSLIGTYYGGNGTTNFQLPNLQGSVPMHWGNAPSGTVYDLGEPLGSTNVTLSSSQVPSHSHTLQIAEGTGAARVAAPSPTTWLGNAEPGQCYVPTGTPNVNLSPSAIGPNTSGNLPHENMQPFLTINFCIAYMGAFPTRN